MLFGQQRGGCEDGDLFAASDGDEGSAQRHLGFAKTYIAADQAVHRAGADHVLNYAVNSRLLVGGFFKAKVVGKGFVVARAVAEGVAFAGGAAGVDVKQLGCAIAHLLGGFAFGFFPLATAQAVQGGFV